MQEALAHCSMASGSSVALHVKVERGPFGEGEGLSSSEVRVLLSAACLVMSEVLLFKENSEPEPFTLRFA